MTGGDWTPYSLDALLDGEETEHSPDWLRRSDGNRLLYGGKLHSLSGEPESGKGWLMLAAAAQIFDEYANGRVLYLDFEDGPASIVGRLLALGVDPDVIRRRFSYVRPSTPVESSQQLEDLIYSHGDDTFLIVLDGVTEGMVLHGLSPYDNVDVARWRELVVSPLLDPLSAAAVVEIDHVVKDKEQRGRYAIGGQHKLAGVDVAYGVKVVTPFGRGRDGVLQLTINKDRPGFVRGFATDKIAAIAKISSTVDGAVSVALEPAGQDAATFRPTLLMQRVSEAVIAEPGLTTNGIERGVQGKAEWVREATRVLIAEGYIKRERDGNAYRHQSERAYLEAQDNGTTSHVPTASQPRPDVNGAGPRPASLPLQGDADAGRTNGTTTRNGTASHVPPLLTVIHDADAELERLTAKGLT